MFTKHFLFHFEKIYCNIGCSEVNTIKESKGNNSSSSLIFFLCVIFLLGTCQRIYKAGINKTVIIVTFLQNQIFYRLICIDFLFFPMLMYTLMPAIIVFCNINDDKWKFMVTGNISAQHLVK